jgi:tetratricopeptide (TPR) repeat protein
LLLGMFLLSGVPGHARNGVSSYWDGVAAGENYLAAGRWAEALARFRGLAQTYPGCYEVELGQGRALLGARRYAEAVSPLRAAVHLRPDLPRPRVLLGRAWMRQKQYARAEEALLAAYNLDPSYEPAWGELAGLYLETGRPAQADSFLALQVARHPTQTALLKKRLGLARSLRHAEVVRATLRQLIAVLPPDQTPEYRRELALDCLGRHELPEAEAQLRAAVKREPKNPDNVALLGQVLLAAGKTDQAAAVLRGLPPQRIRQPDLYLSLAQAELAANQPEAALADARRALTLAPNSEEAVRVAQTAAAQAGHVEEALSYSRRLVALHPRDAEARVALAQALESADRPAEALCQYDLASSLPGPEAVAVLQTLTARAAALGNPAYQLTVERRLAAARSGAKPLSLVDLLLEQRRFSEAQTCLYDASPSCAGDPDLLADEGRLLREVGLPREARQVLEEALRRYPQHPALNLETGLLAAGQGNPAAVLPLLERGLGTESRKREACRALAECAVRCGQIDQAASSLRALVKGTADLSPQAAAALDALARLYAQSAGAEASAAQMGALADARPERADLALAAAAQYERAGALARAGRYYEQAARLPAVAGRALRLAARAYAQAGDADALLRVTATYLTQEAHDPEGLALVVELGAAPPAPSATVQAAALGLVQAEPWSVDYHRSRLTLFAACDRLEFLAATVPARAARTHALGDRVAVALLQERHRDPAGALRTLSGLSPADSSQPSVALLRAQLLHATGQPEAALQALEKVVSPAAPEIPLERGDSLAEVKRPEEALGEYIRALSEGASPSEALARVEELWTGKQVSLTTVLAGLGAACAALPNPAPVRQFVADHLPATDPDVQEWLTFHASANR